ncbi:5'(3')-deoxyribonucleotidase, cytosolic type [Bulinus truncatus]|nr:5'(3')-deoxyribonucleotidase, cytosolic type [Bulinus truncatus]
MDMVVSDFEQHLLKEYRKKYPEEVFIPLQERTGESAEQQYAGIKKELGAKIVSIYTSYGFSLNVPEIPGACSALKAINGMNGVEVFICAPPLVSYEFSLKEKCQWIEEHLGCDWVDKVIHCLDKTLINADLLIDDAINIKGSEKHPTWDHVVFTACHNVRANIGSKKRLNNWIDGSWRKIIEDVKKDIF